MKKFIALLLLAPLAANASVNIGVASAVRGAVKATAPGAAGRVVETGKAVYSHDKISTGPEGKLQILLLDQTSFTIGANSEMELDEFVFDPATNAGKVSAKIVKGAFRFVTGKVARRDPASMQVATPVGTIGIRGTMTAGNVSDSEATIVLLGPGPENNADEKSGGITVKNDKGSTEVDKDGWGVTIKAGEAPSAPFELGGAQLEGILNGVGSAPKADQKDDTASGGSTDSSSGQGTAAGKSNASDAFAAADASQSETTQFASQQFAAPTPLTWADVIAIPGGTGTYSGSGTWHCTGGNCSTPSGSITYGIAVDFGAKTLGGGSSFISESNSGVNASSINSGSYASLSGDAKFNLVPLISGTSNGTFLTADLKLFNVGGVTAGGSSLDLKVSNTTLSQSSAGTADGLR